MRNFKGTRVSLTGVDEHGGGGVQACLLMEGGEVGNTQTIVTNRDDVAVPSPHSSGQVIEIVLDVVSVSICNRARIDLDETA